MLFLAALIHGILIIGVTFNPYLLEDFSDAISLEVTIVADPDQSIDRPDEAEYLAQTSQLGTGNTEDEVRPSAPLQSASPIDNLGEEDAEALQEAHRHHILHRDLKPSNVMIPRDGRIRDAKTLVGLLYYEQFRVE